jgi:5-methylcytosine-specific restriction endonuclease McrA
MPATDWEVRKRDKCTCRYCDLCGLRNFDIWMQLGIDHIIPRISGGDESAENKAVACTQCNCYKAAYIPNGNNREDRIADARLHIKAKREAWRERFEMMMQEIKNSN